MASLAGKVALITGGSRGIGAETARLFAERGASVVIVYSKSEQPALDLADEIRGKGGYAEVVGGDIREAATSEAAVRSAVDKFGGLDILVTAAGVNSHEGLADISEDRYRTVYDVNVLGTLLPIRAASPYMTSPGGRIVTISSRLAENPFPSTALYSGSKAAVIAMTQAFSKELGPKGITVNSVLPGMIETEMTREAVAVRGEMVAAQTPLGRIGQPEDVAGVIAFLASDDSQWVTGRTLRVDGGIV